MTCSVEGCDKPVEARGWCAPHYCRWWRSGDVAADRPFRVRLRGTPEQRFWRHVDRSGGNSCWTWTAGLDKDGYGRFEGRAHRFAYELLRDPIPAGLELDHLCRNRSCVNPAHLEPVTTRENIMRSPVALAAQNVQRTHCPAGHQYSDDNARLYRGRRHCRVCDRIRRRIERHSDPRLLRVA